MRPLGYGLVDGGKGPLQADLDEESMGGVLLKKRGVWVARGGRGQSNGWLLGRFHIVQEGGGPSGVNACFIGVYSEGICRCVISSRRARVGERRGGARGGGGVGVQDLRVVCTSARG